MFTSSLINLSFASILSILPPPEANQVDFESGSAITRQTSPDMAGLWALDTSPVIVRPKRAAAASTEPNTDLNSTGTSLIDKNLLIRSEATEQLQSSTGLSISETTVIRSIRKSPPTLLVTNNAVTYDSTQCVEHYNFGADNIMWTVSGAEWTYGEYVVQPLATDKGSLPLLVIKTLSDNNEPDCTHSQIDQTGDILAVYLDYRPEQQKMYWCLDAEGDNCIMQFRRILP